MKKSEMFLAKNTLNGSEAKSQKEFSLYNDI